MIALLIIVIVTISLAAGIGYSIFSLIKSGEVSLGIQKTQAQMLQMSHMIGGSLQTHDGKIMIPVELTNGAVSNEVPSFIPFRRTAYDKKITYCAVAPTGAQGAYAFEAANGRDYITEGAPPSLAPEILTAIRNANVVAYLLAPAPNTETDLVCTEVSLGSSGTFNLTANGGFAMPIFGTVKGNTTIDVNSAEELTDALNNIAYNRPSDSTINLKTDVNVTTNEINNVTNQLDGRRISIVNKSGSRNLNFTGTATPLEITGGVKFENVKLTGSVPTLEVKPKGILDVINSEVGPITNDLGTVLIGENSFVYGTASASPVSIAGGTVKIHQTATVAPLASPVFKINGGMLYVSGRPNIMITASSSITDFARDTVSVSGGGRIEGNQNEISFAITGSATPSVTLSPLPEVSTSCSGAECVATCSAYGPTAKVVAGSCSAAGSEPLIGSKLDRDAQSYSCSWAINPSAGSHRATAICAY
ncbi:hypothetical protein [Mesorhizobium sp. SP-1A]|uniref:hypothetical protein n=1 Tax=Mesorhizobium sp. SP-1A TaxID=3077840 RepID=UPI0028F70838|nr:hypothetical protein [Mesorhizobium sp. SP-1A]